MESNRLYGEDNISELALSCHAEKFATSASIWADPVQAFELHRLIMHVGPPSLLANFPPEVSIVTMCLSRLSGVQYGELFVPTVMCSIPSD